MSEIVLAGDPVLRTPCRHLTPAEVGTPDFAELVTAMTTVLREAPGVGLAANQVGLDIAVALVEDRAEYQAGVDPDRLAALERTPVDLHVLINPTIAPVGEEQVEWFEACLSLPGHTAIVPRHRRVRVTTLTPTGDLVELEASGWHARILQHEIDHLQGRMYVDRMLTRSFMTAEEHALRWRAVPIPEVKAALGL